ncbi:MAG TPA: O-methyltransferase [Caulobacterales bacterium]|nr:O-methyltransferase [Caulobacterales bacterium]
MTDAPDLYNSIDRYIDELFAVEDEHLKAALKACRSAGLPEIQVSPGQGKLIYLLAKIVGARRILELGTLGGYSTIWLARALPADGRLVTLESETKHAEVARANLTRAGLIDRVQIVIGPALQTLPQVVDGAEPFDLVFIDADKVNYPSYFAYIMRCVRPGALILADNVIRKGKVLAPRDNDPSSGATRAFNAMIAADQRLEAIILQQVGVKGHDGLAIARVK